MTIISLRPLRQIKARVPDVAVSEAGPVDGTSVSWMHGFPYDIYAYAEVASLLPDRRCRVYTPCLRGYGTTRFFNDAMPRSGENAVPDSDLLTLMDALAVSRAVLASYDWGGLAAHVTAAFWPERCSGLNSLSSYNAQNITAAMVLDSPENERSPWYQYYFHSGRGRAGLTADRRGICCLLWNLWSPTWSFAARTFERRVAALGNANIMDMVIHSYRHCFGVVAGDPALTDIKCRLATLFPIAVPSITFHGANDGVGLPASAEHYARQFASPGSHRSVPGMGHNLPQEVPEVFAEAVLKLQQQGFAT